MSVGTSSLSSQIENLRAGGNSEGISSGPRIVHYAVRERVANQEAAGRPNTTDSMKVVQNCQPAPAGRNRKERRRLKTIERKRRKKRIKAARRELVEALPGGT